MSAAAGGSDGDGAFRLPSLGADMDEGTLLSWLVAPGDRVHRGQVLAVVDTAKAAVEVECWQEGIVRELLVSPGTCVPVGTVLARLAPAGAPAGATAAVAAAPSAPAAAPAPAPMPIPARAPVFGPAPAPAPAPADRVRMSPAARQRARELGLDPASLIGHGPGGAVSLADVEAAGARPSSSSAAASARAPAEVTDRQVAMRAAIAAAMSRSKREIPHYYLWERIPMAAALDWLRTRNAERPPAERLLPAALLLRATTRALARVPELNGHWRDGAFSPASTVTLGVAISLRGGGLVAPALADTADRPLAQLMAGLSGLVRRARAGVLRSADLVEPSLTVTQLGDQGAEAVLGVIRPPQVALVGFGRIAERAWAQDGWLRPMPVVVASLAADHRASDGHRGAVFLATLRECLQQPAGLDAPATPSPSSDLSPPPP
ncbi:MAG: 2-oxo acid dehydrogenase subunit E2 [Betaproteobacteria bacterium]|nr:2-oxo acid dehydrogenase subunit E2 [Betaproteobacteria bacterium]